MVSKRVAIAARRLSRGGSSRIAEKRHGAGSDLRSCQAARPTPVPRQTSQARATRWLSSGFSRAAVAGSTAASSACSAAGPQLGQQRCAPPPGRPVRGRGHRRCHRSAPRNTSRTRRSVSAGARRRGPPPSPPVPAPATTRRCRLRRRDGCRRAGGEPGFPPPRCGPGGEEPKLTIHLHRVGIDDRAAQALSDFQRQRGLAAGRRPRDKQRAGPIGHRGQRNRRYGVIAPVSSRTKNCLPLSVSSISASYKRRAFLTTSA